jgi:hypothetical protein
MNHPKPANKFCWFGRVAIVRVGETTHQTMITMLAIVRVADPHQIHLLYIQRNIQQHHDHQDSYEDILYTRKKFHSILGEEFSYHFPSNFRRFLSCQRKENHTPAKPRLQEKGKALPAPKKKAAHQLTKIVWSCSCLQPPAHRPFRPTSSIPRSAMAAPAEETLAAEDTASPPPPARSAGFWFLGEDKSVHKALGGGKSMSLFLIFLSYIVIFLSFFFAS